MANLTITPASVVLVSGELGHGTAGEQIDAGELVYRDRATTGKPAKLVDVDAATETTPVLGLAMNSAETGQPISWAKPGSVVDLGLTLDAGTIYFASDDPGKVCPAGDLEFGDRVVIVGHGMATGDLKLLLIETHETTPSIE